MEKSRRGITQHYKDMGFKRFFTISLCLFLFPVLLLQILYIRTSITSMSEQVNDQVYNNLKQVSEKFTLLLDSYKDTVWQIHSDREIIRNLEQYHEADDARQEYLSYLLSDKLKRFVENKEGIRNISLICSTGESFTYDDQSGSDWDNLWHGYGDLREIPPYQQTKNRNGIVLIPTINFTDGDKTESLFFLGKELYRTQNLKQDAVATLIIGIDEQELENICNGSTGLNTPNVNFISDRQGMVLSFPDVEQIGTVVNDQYDVLEFISGLNMFEGRNLFCSYYRDMKTGWIFHNVYDQDYMMRDINVMQVIYWMLFVADVLVILLFTSSINRYYVNYLNQIIEGIRQMNQGNMDVRLVVDRRDELGQIGENFNYMVDRVKTLIEEVTEISEKKNQAEIKALESQINPHFLYNTLDAINWMAIRNDEIEISKMISNLGLILRYCMNQSNERVNISEMEDWLKAYVSLYQLRYGYSFEFEIYVEPEVRDVRVYKLLVQPIVENAIIHGLKDMEDGFLRVDIGFAEQPERIHVIVEDNGAGMEPEKVEFYNRRDAEWSRSQKIGLANIFERIQLYYGEEGEWHISSVKGMGTVMELLLPVGDMGKIIQEKVIE